MKRKLWQAKQNSFHCLVHKDKTGVASTNSSLKLTWLCKYCRRNKPLRKVRPSYNWQHKQLCIVMLFNYSSFLTNPWRLTCQVHEVSTVTTQRVTVISISTYCSVNYRKTIYFCLNIYYLFNILFASIFTCILLIFILFL